MDQLKPFVYGNEYDAPEMETARVLDELKIAPAAAKKTITSSPTPGHLYRIRRGDSLLQIAGAAYKKKAGPERLQRAQLTNRHPFNWRYCTPGKQSFSKKYFPEGMISFYPRVSCADADFNMPWVFPPEGRCYPLLYIPPETDNWLVPPAEVVQPNLSACWAAAILSWSSVAPGAQRFKSLKEVIDAFSKLEVAIPTSRGVIKRRIVNKSGALVRWPKEAVVFSGKKKVVVPPGRLTLERLAVELGLSLVVKDSTLTLGDIHAILENSQGPVIVLKFGKEGSLGHGTVIFGASKPDGFIGEMDPFEIERPTGPAFGVLGARWLPTLKAFKTDFEKNPWEEFAFLFKKAGTKAREVSLVEAFSFAEELSFAEYEGEDGYPARGLEEEFNFAEFPAAVLKALRSGLERVAVNLAVAFGARNENKLSDLVFFRRHSERGGRLLRKGEKDFQKLSQVWLEIRDQLVRPVLFRAFFAEYDLRFLPRHPRFGIPANKKMSNSEKALRTSDVDAMTILPGPPRRVGELLIRRDRRAKAALEGKVPGRAPLPVDAATTSLHSIARRLSASQLELYREFFPDGTGGINFRAFQVAFEQFANGELRNPARGRGVGEPNGGFYYLFAEFAFLCIDAKIDEATWARLLRTFVKTQEIFIHIYRPAPHRSPPPLGVRLPGVGSAVRSLDAFRDINFNAAGQSDQKRKEALRAKYDRMSDHDLRKAARDNMLRAQRMP